MDTLPLPDREYLERAFNRIRPHYWGTDLDVVLQHPIRRVAVICVARRMQRGEAYSRKWKEANNPVRSMPPNPYRLPAMDNKRRASGEREDD